MSGDWTLQGNTTITDLKLLASKTDLSIYANGYKIVLGAEGNNESLIIGNEENKYYPTIYGGSNNKNITGNTNVTINSGTYQNIYGGSNGRNIEGNTNLYINYAVVNGSVYGGSYGATITGNTNVTIENGKYGVTLAEQNHSSITGGSNNGAIENGSTNLTINGGTVFNGCITGAGNSTQVANSINLTINNLSLGEDGNGTNSIYGYGYNAGATGSNSINLNINIKNLIGKPKYIMGYCYSGGGAVPTTATITMNLENIDSTETEIYAASYNDVQTNNAKAVINSNNVKAKLLSAGGLQKNSIKNYEITVNGGSFTSGIYAGGSVTNIATANVGANGTKIVLNNYTGKLSFNNKNADITLNNSNVTTANKFYYANINLNNSEMSIEKSINSTTSSFGNIHIDKNSTLSINNIENSAKQIIVAGKLTGEGKLKLYDTNTLIVEDGIASTVENPIDIDIIENANNTEHYINIISSKEEESDKLVSAKKVENEQEVDKYNKDYIEHLSYWKFYNNTGVVSKTNCIYLHSTNGNDENEGTIEKPVKTIARATQIMSENSNKNFPSASACRILILIFVTSGAKK